MVMAESERASGSLSTSGTDNTPAARLEWLKQRREALQEKLAKKNNELKNLCIDEAELTGVLPPEIPLDPGESPPIFRKRIGTSFTYPQHIINKLKTNQVEESALELERQVQVGIAAAAFAIVNDLAESKAVRRKHRLIYQQSQRCLKDLESRLNFIRQGYGQLSRSSAASSTDSWPLGHDADESTLEGTSKYHKTKKPRPPLDNQLDDVKSIDKKTWTETEITSTSSSHSNEWPRTKSKYVKHPEWHSSLSPGNSVDQNENLDLYPYEHQRLRTYSHGNWDDSQSIPLRGVKPNHQLDERSYRKISDTYALDADSRAAHWQQKKLMESHKYQVFPNQRHHIDSLQYKQHQQLKSRPQQLYYQEPPLNSREMPSPEVPLLQNGFPQYRYPSKAGHVSMDNQRHQEELISKRMSEGMQKNRGRKSSESSTWCAEEAGWYPNDNYSPKDNFASLDRRKHSSLIREAGIPRDHHNPHRLDHLSPPPPPPPPPPHSRMLLRTQSLGSVEHPNHWQQGTQGNINLSPREHQVDKNHEKEKEWYETSMDGSYQQPLVQRQYPRSSPSPSSISSSPKLMSPTSPMPPLSPSFNEIPVRIVQSTEKDLEIPAETANHAYKYQPYREVTKPFEMSDFYKYSTKFRKKNEVAGGTAQRPDQSKLVNNNNVSYANNNCMEEVHQVPQSYASRRPYELMGRSLPRKNESNNREWSNSEDCRVPPNDSTVV